MKFGNSMLVPSDSFDINWCVKPTRLRHTKVAAGVLSWGLETEALLYRAASTTCPREGSSGKWAPGHAHRPCSPWSWPPPFSISQENHDRVKLYFTVPGFDFEE